LPEVKRACLTKITSLHDISPCNGIGLNDTFVLCSSLTKKEAIMATNALSKRVERLPAIFDDFFKPWNDIMDFNGWGRNMSVPAVNIEDMADAYKLALAVPGLKKSDFKIDVEGNMITISSEKEESKEEKDAKYTRKEYSYSSFSRSFSLPEEVNREKIDAVYEDGVLKVSLPKKEEMKKSAAITHIAVK
jgi:HSP20 family protein